MIQYFLYAIYEDNTTRCGTYANRLFKGKRIDIVIRNFQKMWHGHVYAGQKIIGVEVVKCQGFKRLNIDRVYF